MDHFLSSLDMNTLMLLAVLNIMLKQLHQPQDLHSGSQQSQDPLFIVSFFLDILSLL